MGVVHVELGVRAAMMHPVITGMMKWRTFTVRGIVVRIEVLVMGSPAFAGAILLALLTAHLLALAFASALTNLVYAVNFFKERCARSIADVFKVYFTSGITMDGVAAGQAHERDNKRILLLAADAEVSFVCGNFKLEEAVFGFPVAIETERWKLLLVHRFHRKVLACGETFQQKGLFVAVYCWF